MLAISIEQKLPQENANETDASEDRAQSQACHDLTTDDPPPIAQPNFAERHRANDKGGGLRARIAAAADDQRYEQRQHHSAGNFRLELPHRSGGEHFAQKQRSQPAGAFTNHDQQRHLEIRPFEGLHAADFLNIFGRLFLHDIDDIVDVDDAFDSALRIDNGYHQEMVPHEKLAQGLLV